jgi:hypothetical protein
VPGPGEPTLDEVRAATERFRDVKVALAEGYIRDPGDMCDTAEMMGRPASQGAMGIHFFRPDLLGITGPPSPRVDGTGTHTDFRQPSILIYEPQKDGSLALVAVENLVFARAWRESGQSGPPTFHGVAYDSMVDDPNTATDEAHLFRAALRSPRLDLPRQSEWRVRAVQPDGHLRASPDAEGPSASDAVSAALAGIPRVALA